MAENVHHWTEQMLPELEQMHRVNLFTDKEVKAIIKKRTAHEYKLVRRTKDKKDFLAYIQYEVNLLDLIHKRRKRENYYFKKDEIEFAIVARIHRLFKQATFRWAGDLKLWFSHAQFCIKWKKRVQLSKVCTRLLQVHGNKSKIWVLAAKWQLECSDSVEASRAIFLQALKSFPTSQYIWLEYFRAELLYLEKINQRLFLLSGERVAGVDSSMGTNEAILLKGGAVKIVYKNAVAAIGDNVDFQINIMEVAALFTSSIPCAEQIVQDLADDLKTKYSNNAKALAAVAKLPLKSEIDSGSPFFVNETEKREDLCCQEFEKAMKCLNTIEMWGEYFDFLNALYNDSLTQTSQKWKRLNMLRKSRFFTFAYSAHSSDKLNSDRYCVFVNHLLANGCLDEALKVIKNAYEKLQDAILFTNLTKISFLVSQTNPSLVDKNDLLGQFLSMKCNSQGNTMKQLGTFWLQHAIMMNEYDMAKQIIKSIIHKCGKDESIECQQLYWKWIAGTKGLLDLYELFKESTPLLQKPTLKQYRCVLGVVSCFDAPKVAFQFYENALDHYGSSDPDIWIEFIKLKERQGGQDAMDVGKIYWRAMKTLEPALTEKFIGCYTLLNL